MIQLLTCTGARPEAWELCIRYMQQQNYKGRVKWIIVDDGPRESIVPEVSGWEICVIRPHPFWKPGQNTQHRNMLAGLELVDIEKPLAIIEDDEHYKPGWIKACRDGLRYDKLFGQRPMRKYNVKHRLYKAGDYAHSSLACTATRGKVTEKMIVLCQEKVKLIDLALWRSTKGLQTKKHYVTGIKQMPGRAGIDSCQSDDMHGFADPEAEKLRQWIGADAELYLDYYKRQVNEQTVGNPGLRERLSKPELQDGRPSQEERRTAYRNPGTRLTAGRRNWQGGAA